MKSDKIDLDCWNSWTEKSSDEKFDRIGQGIGKGEYKLGAEFDVEPEGQNSSTHDLYVMNEKWEIKKLDDNDNSFRLGVKISASYLNIKIKVLNCFNALSKIQDQLVSGIIKEKINKIINSANSKHGRSEKSIIDGLYTNEVSGSNFDKLDELIEELKEITHNIEKEITFRNIQEIELYSSYDGKKIIYSTIDAFRKINLEKISKEKKINLFGDSEFFNKIYIYSELFEDLKLFKDTTFKKKLNKITRDVFNDVRLVLVDKQKGFWPVSNIENIYCYRITHGGPRVRVKNL